MSNLIEYAKEELKILDYKPIDEEEGPNRIQENVLELLDVFQKQGHSGFSAFYCIALFSKLAKFEPLSPLTGEESEWTEVAPGVFQNKRCSHVFRDVNLFNGQAYDIEGKIFCKPDGTYYTSKYSIVPVVFPYEPKTEYVTEYVNVDLVE